MSRDIKVSSGKNCHRIHECQTQHEYMSSVSVAHYSAPSSMIVSYMLVLSRPSSLKIMRCMFIPQKVNSSSILPICRLRLPKPLLWQLAATWYSYWAVNSGVYEDSGVNVDTFCSPIFTAVHYETIFNHDGCAPIFGRKFLHDGI